MKAFGHYLLFLSSMFSNREKFRVYLGLVLDECVLIGSSSVFLVTIVSLFLGAVSSIQTAHNLISKFIPKYIIGLIVRDMTILELAPTITSIVLAGKVGSSIAGGLGTMRITEQINALEVMGINSSSYLVLPKIIAAMLTFPMLVALAGFLLLGGGYVAGVGLGLLADNEYVYGIRYGFKEYNVLVAVVKAIVFGFLVSSISAYEGFYTNGGALEVGKSSTSAVTKSCVAILLGDYFIAQIFLQ